MKARDLQSYFQSLNGGWVNLQKTVDTFKAGDPETEATGIAVGWMSYTWALRKALELGCNVFVTHEPTYYNHEDDIASVSGMPGVREKQQFIQDNGLVVLRCHDLWDQLPGIGIPDSWAEWLGLGTPLVTDGYYRVYDVAGKTALDVARQVAARVQAFGQTSVELAGPADKPVSRLAIGTGAITPFFHFVRQYGADLALCTDDGIWYWHDGGYATDMGIPLIVVNHAVAEEAGLRNMAEHLRQHFPGVPVHHIPQRCMYTLVSA